LYDQADFDGIGQVLYHYEEDGDLNTLTVLKFNFDDDDDDADEVDFEIEVIGRFEFSEDNLII
jgi:hypothetical protein